MIECPQCNNNITGSRCSCGYVSPSAKFSSTVIHRNKDKDDAEHAHECKQWLMNTGVTNDSMSKSEWDRSTALYRKRIGREPPPDSLQWAKDIIQRVARGDTVKSIQYRMASEALGLNYENM